MTEDPADVDVTMGYVVTKQKKKKKTYQWEVALK